VPAPDRQLGGANICNSSSIRGREQRHQKVKQDDSASSSSRRKKAVRDHPSQWSSSQRRDSRDICSISSGCRRRRQPSVGNATSVSPRAASRRIGIGLNSSMARPSTPSRYAIALDGTNAQRVCPEIRNDRNFGTHLPCCLADSKPFTCIALKCSLYHVHSSCIPNKLSHGNCQYMMRRYVGMQGLSRKIECLCLRESQTATPTDPSFIY
jgi:hypothetical protein